MMIWDEDKWEKVIRERNIDFAQILDIFDDAFAVETFKTWNIPPLTKLVIKLSG